MESALSIHVRTCTSEANKNIFIIILLSARFHCTGLRGSCYGLGYLFSSRPRSLMTLYCVWLLFNREARPVVYLAPAAEEVSKDEAVSLLLNTRHETCRCMSSCNAGVKSVECHLHALMCSVSDHPPSCENRDYRDRIHQCMKVTLYTFHFSIARRRKIPI